MARTLRMGDQGDDVRAVQDVLNFHIRRLAPLKVDGKFGPLTKARVTEFQRANSLLVDGIVGPQTNGKLFEIEVTPFSLGIIPKLLLTLPQFGASLPPSGIRPPTLIPPLTLPEQSPSPSSSPGFLPLPVLTPIQLPSSSTALIPPLNSKGQILNLTLTVPARNDPQDPAVRSFKQIVQVLESLPPNFPFRTMIIGAVPNPVKKIPDLGFGFTWGIDPTFDLKKLSGPTEFLVGVKGNAGYTLKVIDKAGPGGMKVGIFAKGDFKAELDYTSERATSRPQILLQGSALIGVGGTF